MFWIGDFVQVVLGVLVVASLCFGRVFEPVCSAVVRMEFVLLFIVCPILLL